MMALLLAVGDLDPTTTIGGLLALLLSALTGAQNVQMSGMRADLAKFSADLARFAGDLATASEKHRVHVDNHTRDIADLRSRVVMLEADHGTAAKKRSSPRPVKAASRKSADR